MCISVPWPHTSSKPRCEKCFLERTPLHSPITCVQIWPTKAWEISEDCHLCVQHSWDLSRIQQILNIIHWIPVLGLARTGLIFTRSQEGTQPDRPTQTGQTEQGIRYHVPPCWVPGGGAGWGEGSYGSGACGAPGGESCSVHFTVLFCIFFLSVLLLLLFISFAVLLNWPYPNPWVFALFSSHSPPHPSGGSGDRATAWTFVAGDRPKLQ